MNERSQQTPPITTRQRRYSFVHLEFGSAHRKASLALLARLARRIPSTHCRLVIVDNAGVPAPLAMLAPFDEIVLLKGDNTSREFSGWDVAAGWLKDNQMRPRGEDGYIFSNDTVVRHRGFGIGRKLRFARTFVRLINYSIPIIGGEIDGLAAPVVMPWGRHALYVSTYLFGMNRAAFERLTPFCALSAQIDALLTPRWPADSLFTAIMPSAYAQHLARWLHEPGGWYAAQPLSAANFPAMRAKATSILIEHTLSARLDAAGGRLVSIYDGDTFADRMIGALADQYERHWRISTQRRQLWERWFGDGRCQKK